MISFIRRTLSSVLIAVFSRNSDDIFLIQPENNMNNLSLSKKKKKIVFTNLGTEREKTMMRLLTSPIHLFLAIENT